jgi:hypothetical protein
MANEARHHHYIPQAYLKGFAHKRSERQWYTHVTDFSADRTYTANVRNVCGERDFMRIEVDGYAPDAIENEMANFEAQCISAIRRIAETGKFDGEDANSTLNLMALMAVRSPEMRENLRGFHEQVAKRVMDVALSTKDRWEGQTARMRADGVPVNDATYEDVKSFHKREQYKVTLAREYHIGTEFKMMGTVLELLGHRLWTVYTTDGSNGEFLTTNRPVTLTYIDPENVPPLYRRSPGFGLTNTEVHFPLTRHAMLVGRFDRGGHTEVANESFIAAVNTHMMWRSHGKAFSRLPEFVYLNPRDLTINRDGLLLEKSRAWKESASVRK